MYQGTRIGEALALTYEDIDFINNKISITKSKDSKNRVGTPKTTESNRIIPLFNDTLTLLNKNSKGIIFKSLSYDKVQKFLKHIQTEYKIKLTSHILRHTFATRCIENGVNIKTVSKWLGHTDISITNKIYTHINEDFEQEEIGKVNTPRD